MYCFHCGQQIPDGVQYCSFCGADQTTKQINSNAAPAQQPPTSNNQNGSFIPDQNAQYQAQLHQVRRDISNAKTLGTLSIVFGIIIFFVGIVLAIIANGKANTALETAMMINDPTLIKEAKSAKRTATLGFRIACLIVGIAGICFLVYQWTS